MMYEHEKGFTETQWNWIQDTAESQAHVFFFTHGRIVGGGAEQNCRLAYYTKEFVEWANRPDVNVRAVFVGHTHQNNISYSVSVWDIDKPLHWFDNPTESHVMKFTDSTYYIETDTSTRG